MLRRFFFGGDIHRRAFRPARRATAPLVIVLLLTVCMPLPSVAATRVADRIVAIVNKDLITLSEMTAELKEQEARLRRQHQGMELDRRLRHLAYTVLTRLIEHKLQIQLAEEKGHVVTDEEVRMAMREFADQGEEVDQTDPRLVKTFREHLTVLRVLDREVRSGIMVSEDELTRYYEDHLSRFILQEEYRISQILIRPRPGEAAEETRARATDVYETLRRGAGFTELALARSDGTEATQGGSLGFVKQGELESPIEHAIARLQPGEFSKPIQTDDGFHIVLLDERKPPAFRQYPQVKPEIRHLVFEQKGEERYHKWMAELKDKAYIDVRF